jgi:YgiT-type zinc finger domain-containing protein
MKENVKQSEAVLRCRYCGYDTYKDFIKAVFWRGNRLIVIEDISARLCERCGEQFLDEQVTQKIEKLLKNPGAESRQIQVSVYDISELESAEEYRPFHSIRANRDSQTSLQCKYCESETVEELVKSAFWVNEQLIAVENIPAWVCQHCKAQFYDDETAETIAALEKLRAVPDEAIRNVTASVFSLTKRECRGQRIS